MSQIRTKSTATRKLETRLFASLEDATWEESSTKGVPLCFFPKSYSGGYKMDGKERETQLGYQATLRRRSASTIYGQDIDENHT
ncbi:hypothetical protein OS493_003604 [Desmophyllum pertusum]|uniref:Uncharacterized protein n=1 Tax=Desmophyllum pertusum TaxID=174260 RepID=A0A9X0A6I1_9CNID|nr:hypothetical protein OS493_003604 [Desmophyllum pertusum]